MSEVPRRGDPGWRPELSPCCQAATEQRGFGCASVSIWMEHCCACGERVNRYAALQEDMRRLKEQSED